MAVTESQVTAALKGVIAGAVTGKVYDVFRFPRQASEGAILELITKDSVVNVWFLAWRGFLTDRDGFETVRGEVHRYTLDFDYAYKDDGTNDATFKAQLMATKAALGLFANRNLGLGCNVTHTGMQIAENTNRSRLFGIATLHAQAQITVTIAIG